MVWGSRSQNLRISGFWPAHQQTNALAATSGTDQPLTPFQNSGPRTVSSNHLGGVGLGLMPAGPAPENKRTRAAAALPSVIGARLQFHRREVLQGYVSQNSSIDCCSAFMLSNPSAVAAAYCDPDHSIRFFDRRFPEWNQCDAREQADWGRPPLTRALLLA
jgi:hypothetical protein